MSLNLPGRDAGAIGMVLACTWPAEYRDAAVFGIVDDLPSGPFDRIADMVEPVIEIRLSLVEIATGDMLCRSHHIDSEHRDDISLRSPCARDRHVPAHARPTRSE